MLDKYLDVLVLEEILEGHPAHMSAVVDLPLGEDVACCPQPNITPNAVAAQPNTRPNAAVDATQH